MWLLLCESVPYVVSGWYGADSSDQSSNTAVLHHLLRSSSGRQFLWPGTNVQSGRYKISPHSLCFGAFTFQTHCMCVCVCVDVKVCVCMWVCMYVWCVYVCVYGYVCMWVCVYICKCGFCDVGVFVWVCMYMSAGVFMCGVCMYACVAQVYVCVSVWMCVHMLFLILISVSHISLHRTLPYTFTDVIINHLDQTKKVQFKDS